METNTSSSPAVGATSRRTSVEGASLLSNQLKITAPSCSSTQVAARRSHSHRRHRSAARLDNQAIFGVHASATTVLESLGVSSQVTSHFGHYTLSWIHGDGSRVSGPHHIWQAVAAGMRPWPRILSGFHTNNLFLSLRFRLRTPLAGLG